MDCSGSAVMRLQGEIEEEYKSASGQPKHESMQDGGAGFKRPLQDQVHGALTEQTACSNVEPAHDEMDADSLDEEGEGYSVQGICQVDERSQRDDDLQAVLQGLKTEKSVLLVCRPCHTLDVTFARARVQHHLSRVHLAMCAVLAKACKCALAGRAESDDGHVRWSDVTCESAGDISRREVPRAGEECNAAKQVDDDRGANEGAGLAGFNDPSVPLPAY